MMGKTLSKALVFGWGLLVVLAGCGLSPFDVTTEATGVGSVVLQLPTAGTQSRTIFAQDLNVAIATVAIAGTLSGTDGQQVATVSLPAVAVGSFGPNGYSIGDLAPGTWSFTVTGKNAGGVVVGAGSATLAVVAGVETPLSVLLLPPAGEGRIDIALDIRDPGDEPLTEPHGDLTMPGSAFAVSLQPMTDPTAAALQFSNSDFNEDTFGVFRLDKPIPSGAYRLRFTFNVTVVETDGPKTRTIFGVSDSLYVYPDRTSRQWYAFWPSDLGSTGPAPYTGNYSGELSTMSGLSYARPDHYADFWQFELTASTVVGIGMYTDAFDTYLAIYEGTPAMPGALVVGNDDYEGTNSFVETTLAAGTYFVDATTYGYGATGPYVLDSSVDLTWVAPPPRFGLNYDGNGHSLGSPPPPLFAPEGATVPVAHFTELRGPQVVPGDQAITQRLIGWNTAADGSGVNYAPGATVAMPGADLTLYAVWTSDFGAIGKIGPAGGWVFYDKGTITDGWRYLEAAPNDAYANAPFSPDSSIGGNGYVATFPEIGQGVANTARLLDVRHRRGEYDSAVYAAADAVFNYYSGWFLPSHAELSAMFNTLQQAGLGQFAPAKYWSSTDNDGDDGKALVVDFNNGGITVSEPVNIYNKVRPVRAFAGANPTRNVRYYSNIVVGWTVPIDPIVYDAYTAPSVMALNPPSTLGFDAEGGEVEFAGWNTDPSGYGYHFDPGWPVDMNAHGWDLYAMWQPRQYSVDYLAQGGVDPPTDANSYGESEPVAVLGPGTMSYAPYHFWGWQYNSVVRRVPETIVMPAAHVVFTAVWMDTLIDSTITNTTPAWRSGGTFSRLWEVAVADTRTVRIAAEGDIQETDLVVVVYQQSGPGTIGYAEDDNSGPGMGAFMEITLVPGTYVIEVTSPAPYEGPAWLATFNLPAAPSPGTALQPPN